MCYIQWAVLALGSAGRHATANNAMFRSKLKYLNIICDTNLRWQVDLSHVIVRKAMEYRYRSLNADATYVEFYLGYGGNKLRN